MFTLSPAHEMQVLPGRSYNAAGYRYGFNGQERSSEINDNSFTAEYWEYDARIGRRWNVDPVVKAWLSGYACFENDPLYYTDINGADPEKQTPEKDIAGTQNLEGVVVKSTIHDKEKGEAAKKAGFRSSIFKDLTWGRPEDPRDLYPGDNWLQRKFVTGQMNGHNAAIIVGTVLQRGGEVTTTFGEEGAVLAGPETAGIGSAIGVGVALAGTGIRAYGGTIQIKATAGLIAAGVMMSKLAADGNPQTNGSDGGGSSSGGSDPSSVYPSKETAENSAAADRVGKRGFTEVGYQFNKHAGRPGTGSAWKKYISKGKSLNPAAYNEAGKNAFQEIWEAPGGFEKVGSFLEKRLPDGRGIRLQQDGLFKGFID